MTRVFGHIFLDVKNGAYSTDDDKHKARFTKSIAEGFVRKRHSVGGGYGSVMHMTVSALSGFITGGVMNSVTGNDVKSLKEMYTSMTGSRGEKLNLDNMQQEKEQFLVELDEWNGLHRGTHPRTPCLLSFPFTFGHRKDPRNVDEHGPSISRFSERWTKSLKGYMSAMVHRDFKGSVVLMSTNHKAFAYPVHRSYHEHMEADTAITVHNEEDTIVGGTYFTTNEEDTEFEPDDNAFFINSDSDAQTDEADTHEEEEEEYPALGSVISSQTSLLGQDYGNDSDSSTTSSLPVGQRRITRLQRLRSDKPLELEHGLLDTVNLSDNSSNDSSETDSDTSDDDLMYHNCEGEEPSVEDYANQKHTKMKNIPAEEALVSYRIHIVRKS